MNIELNSKKENDKIIYKPNNKNNKIGNYEIIKTLGEGTFGKVKLAIHIPTNEKVAIKILEKSRIEDNDDLQCINREITFLKTLNHINIISLYEIIENTEYYYIIMEYAENDLFTYIVQNNFLSEETASLFYFQIIKAIEYIHKYKIVHRDLKPENILLSNNNTIIKIIDFGLANSYKNNHKNIIENNNKNENNNNKNEIENNYNNENNNNDNNNENLLNTLCGSPCYAAPEMVLGKKYNGLNIDIWSSGIILFAMVCGYLPFEDDDNEVIYRKIILGKFEIPDRLSNNCKDLINKILEINPKKRIKINEILKHPFLKSCDDKFNKIISPYGIYYNNNCYIYNFIIDKIIDMKIKNCDNKNEIIDNIKKNNFNQITSLYKLLLKQAIKNNEINSKNNVIINNNIDGCASLSSCKTCASNNTKNDNNKIKKDKNNTPENNKNNLNNNNFSNYNKFKSNINLDALDKLIKIHSLNENKLNNLKKKKINFLNNNNNNNYKTKRTIMKNYEDLMNNVKKILSNRNGRNENSSSSVELNLNFNKTDSNNIKGKKNNFLSSSNLRVNTIRFSADAPRYTFFQEAQKDEYIVNEKTNRKKPLSIITNGNNFIDSYDNLIINTDYNVNSKLNKLEKLDENIKKLKKVISGLSSPKLYSIKTCNNNNSLKKKNVTNVNFNYKNMNNNLIKSKNKLIQNGKLYTKTVSVINHLNLICNTSNNNNNNNFNNKNNNNNTNNNKSTKKNRKNKNSLDLKKLNLNFRDMTNCRFLLKTFIDSTNSKSPFNLKSKKNQNIKNLTNNSTPSNRNCTFTFKEKPSPKNLEDKYFTNKKIELNKENKNENLKFLSNIIKNDFICFSTKLSVDDVYIKIKNFFNKVNYRIIKKDKNHFDIYNKNIHFISIEISKVEQNKIVNIYHILDNKSNSKNLIKNLIAEIGF